MNLPQIGIYKHYAGAFYLVTGVSQHTERDEVLVTYVPLTGNEGRAGLRMRSRPLTGKKGFLTPENGVERFVFIGQEMPDANGDVVG